MVGTGRRLAGLVLGGAELQGETETSLGVSWRCVCVRETWIGATSVDQCGMMRIVRVAVAEVVLTAVMTGACQANTDLVCRGPSCVCRQIYALFSRHPTCKRTSPKAEWLAGGHGHADTYVPIGQAPARAAKSVVRGLP